MGRFSVLVTIPLDVLPLVNCTIVVLCHFYSFILRSRDRHNANPQSVRLYRGYIQSKQKVS